MPLAIMFNSVAGRTEDFQVVGMIVGAVTIRMVNDQDCFHRVISATGTFTQQATSLQPISCAARSSRHLGAIHQSAAGIATARIGVNSAGRSVEWFAADRAFHPSALALGNLITGSRAIAEGIPSVTLDTDALITNGAEQSFKGDSVDASPQR